MSRPRLRRPVVVLAAAFAIAAVAASVFSCAPRWLLGAVRDRYPDCLYFVETDRPIVALTLDDGPHPEGTPAVLEVLAAHEVRATFFLIGSHVAGNEDLVAEIVGGGHELANHLLEDRPSHRHSRAEFERRLRATHAQLDDFQTRVHWFRPGSGLYNESMIEVLSERDYRCALGSVYPLDAQIPWRWWAASYVRRNARPGSIIVLHAGARGARTAEVLARVIPELTRRGYQITTLSELVRSQGGRTGEAEDPIPTGNREVW